MDTTRIKELDPSMLRAAGQLGLTNCRSLSVVPLGGNRINWYGCTSSKIADHIDSTRVEIARRIGTGASRIHLQLIDEREYVRLLNLLPKQQPFGYTNDEIAVYDTISTLASRGITDCYLQPYPATTKLANGTVKEGGGVLRVGVFGSAPIAKIYEPDEFRAISNTINVKILRGGDVQQGVSGSMRLQYNGADLFLRVQAIPLIFPGSRAHHFSIRIHQSADTLIPFDRLGFTDSQQALFLQSLEAENLSTLVFGPPGSGKTTALYAGCQRMNCESKAIYSIEDPVEIYIPGMIQIPVSDVYSHEAVFADLKRSAPGFVLLGETLEPEVTGKIFKAMLSAVPTATSGHAGTVPQGILQIESMGIPREQLCDSIGAMIAQRLVSIPCPQCVNRKPPSLRTRNIAKIFHFPLPENVLVRLPSFSTWIQSVLRPTEGNERVCHECFGSGYGPERYAIGEVVPMHQRLRDAIMERKGAVELAKAAYYAKSDDTTPLYPPIVVQGLAALSAGRLDEESFLRLPLPEFLGVDL